MTAARAMGVAAALLATVVLGACGWLAPPQAAPQTVTVQASQPPPTTPSPSPSMEQVVVMDDAELASRFGSAVHMVESTGCDATWTGSAWAIDEHHLVTNHHVVANDATPLVISRDGAVVDGEVVGWREDPDIAVIRVAEELPTTLRWAPTEELSEGQRIVALGYPAPAGDFSVTGGSIISFERDGGTRPVIRSDSAIDRGNSGGPALTADGRVAGVATAVDVNPGQLRMVSLLWTADALEELVDGFIAQPSAVTVDCGGAVDGPDRPEQAPSDQPWDYGDDPDLDALWDDCEGGDDDACDELYWESAWGSGYEAFATTCGGRGLGFGTCAGWTWETESPPADDGGGSTDDWFDYDALDTLWDACEGGDYAACDDLYFDSPVNSEYESFGSTCGDREAATGGGCTWLLEGELDEPTTGGDGWSEAYTYGDDSYLDDLWDACEGGDDAACGDLYWESPAGSAYEEFGYTCAGRLEWCW